MNDPRAIFGGVGFALGAAAAFGVTIPLIAWAGSGVGPFTTAALLYLGAALISLAQKPFFEDAGASTTRTAVPSLVVMALAGGAVAPTLLAWGLQHSDPATSGLLLNTEAAWTAVLARLAFKESLGRRAAIALVVMALGGVVLALRADSTGAAQTLGIVAVIGATFAWGVDNIASRTLAELKPLNVVAMKGVLGAGVTLLLALGFGEVVPPLWRIGALLVAGATGYGLSLRFYLLAQRRLGAARTASVFSIAPFIGAALGLAIDPSALSWQLLVAAVLFVLGVVLHAAERHEHLHVHAPVDHDHAHRHDDGHHGHHHDEAVAGEHSHPHRHEAMEHAHEHGPDIHHGHAH